jgi:oligosaccharide repeat unit polymerase
MNFNTLNEMILKSQDYMYGINTFKSLIQLFKIDQAFGINYVDEFNTFGKLATIIGDPYLDFGYLGVAFFAFIYGVFVSSVYREYSNNDSLGYTIAWSIVCYMMMMSVFANYFNVLFMWICLFLSFSLNYKLRIIK